jgi:serine carboxypeptidase-like clade 2
MSLVYTQYDKIDIYNVYAPKCNTDESALSSSSKNTVEKTAKVIAHSVTSAGTVEILQ